MQKGSTESSCFEIDSLLFSFHLRTFSLFQLTSLAFVVQIYKVVLQLTETVCRGNDPGRFNDGSSTGKLCAVE